MLASGVSVVLIAKRSNIGFRRGPRVFDPEERSGARSKRRTHRAMAAHERRVRTMSCDARALRAPQEQGEYRGRLLWVTFLGEARKVTAPWHERDGGRPTNLAKNNVGWYQFVVR